MSIPKNNICPICRVPLREYHDYVTCPTCGTSYHEKCWRENNGCPVCDVVEEPVSPAPPAALSWYLYHSRRNLGPLTWEELCNHPGIQPGDMVWNKEMPDWVRADQVPELLEQKTPEEKPEEPDLGVAPPEAAEPAPPLEETPPEAEAEPKAEEEQEYLFAPKPKLDEEDAEMEAEADIPGDEEPPAMKTAPPPPAESAGAEPKPEEPEEPAIEAVPPKAAEPAPEVRSEAVEPQVETVEGDQKPEALAVEPAAAPAEPETFDTTRTEQLLDQIYTDPEEEPDDSTATALEDTDGQAKETLVHARQVIAGIMLVLGGAIATAITYFRAPLSGTLYYLIAGAAIIFGVAGFFRGLTGWLKLRPWHTED